MTMCLHVHALWTINNEKVPFTKEKGKGKEKYSNLVSAFGKTLGIE